MRRPRLARDSVRVTLRGAAPERVISACASQGVSLRNVTPVENYHVSVTVSAFQVGKLRKISSKYQCEVERVSFSPLGRLLRGGRRRALLAGLVLLACLGAWLSSLFVWEIRVDGNDTIPTGAILRALDDCGVRAGTFWPGMNIDLVRSGVQRRVPGLEWFTVNLRGSVAEVHVRERVEAPEIVDNDAPYSLYAADSGVIVHIAVLQGQPVVQRGEFVAAGQRLVSGAPEDLQGSVRGVHALGSVRVRTAYCLTASLPQKGQTVRPDGRAHRRWGVQIGKKRVFFGKSSSIPGILCDKLYSVSVCAVPGLMRLPVAVVREETAPLACTDAGLSEKTARARLEKALTDALLRLIGPDGEVVSQHFTASDSGGVFTLTLRCECEHEIAVEQPCEIPKLPKGSGDHE